MKLLGQIGLVIVFFVAIVGLRSCNRQQKNDDSVEQTLQIVQKLSAYPDAPAFFDEAFSKFHDRAFNASYKSKRFGSSFDEKIYKLILFGEIMKEADRQRKKQIAEFMRKELKKLRP